MLTDFGVTYLMDEALHQEQNSIRTKNLIYVHLKHQTKHIFYK